jgi:hypothetical protein
MPIQVKDINTIAQKFVTRAGAAANDYKSGVMNPRTDQAAAAAAAEPVWAQAIADAAANHRFSIGVNRAGTAKWQAKASTIGVQRYPQGVQAAQSAYAAGEQPYLAAISGLTLPPRGVKGTNVGRVQAVVDALRKVKVGH